MSALRDLLSRYREQYGGGAAFPASGTIDGSKRVKGDWLEQICLYYFSHDNTQQQQFSDVWLWKDWPENNGEHDTGIDIVARLRGNDGTEGGASPKFAAIQCKFYAEGHTVGKPAIDSFLAASSKACFARRVIVSTSAWGTNAEAAIQNQEPPVTRINIDDMEASNIDWSSFDIDDIGKTALNPPKQLRDHQRDAIAAYDKRTAELNGEVKRREADIAALDRKERDPFEGRGAERRKQLEAKGRAAYDETHPNETRERETLEELYEMCRIGHVSNPISQPTGHKHDIERVSRIIEIEASRGLTEAETIAKHDGVREVFEIVDKYRGRDDRCLSR